MPLVSEILTIFSKDATAGFSVQLHDAAKDIIWPTIVDNVTTVSEWAATLDEASKQ